MRTLRVNCGDDTNCSCRQQAARGRANRTDGVAPHTLRIQLATYQTRTEQYQGRDHIVVPVVMARAGIVMNGSLVPEEEFFPDAWNGVPVTVGHPQTPQDGGFTSANQPDIIETWAVGQIFNARVEDHALKAEAWIDVQRADEIHPGLVTMLTSGETLDVSTGYFARDEKARGVSNGRAYESIARDLLPDHLALLPGDVGACSWEDGCGVRNSRGRSTMSDRITAAVNKIKESLLGRMNERGEDDDWRQMIADLISSDASPFVPDDMDSLTYMSRDTLKRMRDDYLGEGGDASGEDDEEGTGNSAGAGNSNGGHDLADNRESGGQASASESELPRTVGELNTLIANAVGAAIGTALEPVQTALKTNALTDDDRTALAQARRIQEENRAGLVQRIVANSAITKEQAEAMPLEQLEVVANGLRTPASFEGRPSPVLNAMDDDSPEVAAMVTPNAGDMIRERRANGRAN